MPFKYKSYRYQKPGKAYITHLWAQGNDLSVTSSYILYELCLAASTWDLINSGLTMWKSQRQADSSLHPVLKVDSLIQDPSVYLLLYSKHVITVLAVASWSKDGCCGGSDHAHFPGRKNEMSRGKSHVIQHSLVKTLPGSHKRVKRREEPRKDIHSVPNVLSTLWHSC